MISGIYKIENLINGKIYIGKSKDINRRWYEHKSDFKNPKKNHIALYRAMNKYGLENFSFSIIEECQLNNKILSEREIYWINYYDSYKNGYNETLGGEGQFKYNPIEIQTLWDDGLSVFEIASKLCCDKQVIYDTLKEYASYSTTESQLRAEPKRKELLSTAASQRQSYPVYQYDLEGNFIAEFSNLSEAANSFGYKRDNSIKKVINSKERLLAYGYQWSKEKVNKMPAYHNKNKIAVKNINTNLIFPSIRAAAVWAGVNKDSIRRSLINQNKPAGKMPDTNEPLYWKEL